MVCQCLKHLFSFIYIDLIYFIKIFIIRVTIDGSGTTFVNLTHLRWTYISCTMIGSINCLVLSNFIAFCVEEVICNSIVLGSICINLIYVFAAITFPFTRSSLWTNFLTKSGMAVALPHPLLIWSCPLWLLPIRPSGKRHETKMDYSHCCGDDKNHGVAGSRVVVEYKFETKMSCNGEIENWTTIFHPIDNSLKMWLKKSGFKNKK